MKTTTIRLGFLTRTYINEIIDIENESFVDPWSISDFEKRIASRDCIARIARTVSGEVAGFMVYELHPNSILLLSLAVSTSFRRQGVGTEMVHKLIGKLSKQRGRIMLDITESNLPAQLFFRSCGFRAISTIRDPEMEEDAYLFRYSASPSLPSNSQMLMP